MNVKKMIEITVAGKMDYSKDGFADIESVDRVLFECWVSRR
jgi:hypothetical protein